jgi:hypothetical protein
VREDALDDFKVDAVLVTVDGLDELVLHPAVVPCTKPD